MPHIIIEYSANVADHHDVDALIAVIHETATATHIGPLGAMRARATSREQYRIADGHTDNAMVSIIARLGPGRWCDSPRGDLFEVGRLEMAGV